MKKTLVILANSIRSGCRCVAGKEIGRNNAGDWVPGAWIRPVTSLGTGEVHPYNCLVNVAGKAREIAPLDIVEVEFTRATPDEFQCENWALDVNVPMRWIGKASQSLVNACVETPTSLWYNVGMDVRKISCEMAKIITPHECSLVFVQVENAVFSKFVKFYGGESKTKRQATFTYRGVPYQLPITDPMMDKHFAQALDGVYRPSKPQCCIVASLAKPFRDGMRYKIVASILEAAA